MKENVSISLVSKQTQGEYQEVIKQEFIGSYYTKADIHYFLYQDAEGQKVTIKLKSGTLSLIKSGKINWLHIFRPGQTAVSRYSFEFGSVFLEIKTEDIRVTITTDGWNIELYYTLFAEDEEPVKFELNFEVKRGVKLNGYCH